MNIFMKCRQGMANRYRPVSKRQVMISAAVLSAVLLVVLLLGYIPGSRSKAPDFALYTSNQGAFSIQAPDGHMEFSSSPWSFLDHKITKFTHISSHPTGSYTVIHFDMPPGVISPSDRSSIFNTLITGYFEEFNGIMEQSDPVEIEGNSGMSALATGVFRERPMVGEVMVVMVANRIFIIGAYGEKSEIRNKDIRHFLNSFTFNF